MWLAVQAEGREGRRGEGAGGQEGRAQCEEGAGGEGAPQSERLPVEQPLGAPSPSGEGGPCAGWTLRVGGTLGLQCPHPGCQMLS